MPGAETKRTTLPCFLRLCCKLRLPGSCSEILPFVPRTLILWPKLMSETAGPGGGVLQAAKVLRELVRQIRDREQS